MSVSSFQIKDLTVNGIKSESPANNQRLVILTALLQMAALEIYWEHRHDLQLAMHPALECKEAPSEHQANEGEVVPMSNHTPQQTLLQELAQLFGRFKAGGDLAPIQDRDQWDELVRSNPPEEQELVNELARFADLWRYFQERNEKLGPEIVTALAEVHKLPVASRAARVREINQKLMDRRSRIRVQDLRKSQLSAWPLNCRDWPKAHL